MKKLIIAILTILMLSMPSMVFANRTDKMPTKIELVSTFIYTQNYRVYQVKDDLGQLWIVVIVRGKDAKELAAKLPPDTTNLVFPKEGVIVILDFSLDV